jgi:carbon monoxide dehydrogenase subunit G
VPAPIDRAWAYLLDVERVAPCAPGAELTETVDDRTWKGTITMKLGPVSLSFAGTVTINERDDANHRVVLAARGLETRGKGAASATVTSWLEERGPDATLVRMQADISLTGTVAQLSRGLLPDVSKRLTAEFADCLRDAITAEHQPAPAAGSGPIQTEAGVPSATAPPPAPSRPSSIGGIRLGLWALGRAIVRFARRLLGR